MGLSGLWHNVTEYTKFFVYREWLEKGQKSSY